MLHVRLSCRDLGDVSQRITDYLCASDVDQEDMNCYYLATLI
jgi:hypothetical protein